MRDASLFGADQKHLGISDASWGSCYNSFSSCSEPPGACTEVSGGPGSVSPYDQFATFRSQVGVAIGLPLHCGLGTLLTG